MEKDLQLLIVPDVHGRDRYVFLDIDGVVTSGRSQYSFDEECLGRLGRILEATDARIVVTSSWKGQTVQETVGYLTDVCDPLVAGHPFPFCDRIVGITADWPAIDDRHKRGKEVEAYLKTHSCASYVILDDGEGFLPGQMDHLVHTHDSVGISEEDVIRAIDILMG